MNSHQKIPETEEELYKEIGKLEYELEIGEQWNRNKLDGWSKEGLKERLKKCKDKLKRIKEANNSNNDNRILLKG